VIEVDPALKRELYATLALSGSTLKQWFVQSAERFCESASQKDLFDDAAPAQRAKAGTPLRRQGR